MIYIPLLSATFLLFPIFLLLLGQYSEVNQSLFWYFVLFFLHILYIYPFLQFQITHIGDSFPKFKIYVVMFHLSPSSVLEGMSPGICNIWNIIKFKPNQMTLMLNWHHESALLTPSQSNVVPAPPHVFLFSSSSP